MLTSETRPHSTRQVHVAATARSDAQPRRLLVSLFGLFVRAEVNWISVAALIRMLGDLGVGEQAVRSSISRLKRRGTLIGSRIGGAAGYSPSGELTRALADGDRRIFAQGRATLNDGWVTAVFSVPEEQRKRRHELRTALASHGFGIISPGAWIAPGTIAAETPEMLRRRHLHGYVTLIHGHLVGADNLHELVGSWWNLPELATQYQDFIDRYSAVVAEGISDRDAFARYVPMVTEWRRLPYLDPGLPLEVLPEPWPGERATTLFHRLHDRLSAPASRYASSVIDGAAPSATSATA